MPTNLHRRNNTLPPSFESGWAQSHPHLKAGGLCPQIPPYHHPFTQTTSQQVLPCGLSEHRQLEVLSWGLSVIADTLKCTSMCLWSDHKTALQVSAFTPRSQDSSSRCLCSLRALLVCKITFRPQDHRLIWEDEYIYEDCARPWKEKKVWETYFFNTQAYIFWNQFIIPIIKNMLLISVISISPSSASRTRTHLGYPPIKKKKLFFN